eukprot:8159-Heterococcus_DN1.PRE.5
MHSEQTPPAVKVSRSPKLSSCDASVHHGDRQDLLPVSETSLSNTRNRSVAFISKTGDTAGAAVIKEFDSDFEVVHGVNTSTSFQGNLESIRHKSCAVPSPENDDKVSRISRNMFHWQALVHPLIDQDGEECDLERDRAQLERTLHSVRNDTTKLDHNSVVPQLYEHVHLRGSCHGDDIWERGEVSDLSSRVLSTTIAATALMVLIECTASEVPPGSPVIVGCSPLHLIHYHRMGSQNGSIFENASEVYMPAQKAQRRPAEAHSTVGCTEPFRQKAAAHQEFHSSTAAARWGHHKSFRSEPCMAVDQQCTPQPQLNTLDSSHALLTSTSRGSNQNMSDRAMAMRLRQRQHLISDVLLQERLLRECQLLHSAVYPHLPLADLRFIPPHAMTPAAAVGAVVVADDFGSQGLHLVADATFDPAVSYIETFEDTFLPELSVPFLTATGAQQSIHLQPSSSSCASSFDSTLLFRKVFVARQHAEGQQQPKQHFDGLSIARAVPGHSTFGDQYITASALCNATAECGGSVNRVGSLLQQLCPRVVLTDGKAILLSCSSSAVSCDKIDDTLEAVKSWDFAAIQ